MVGWSNAHRNEHVHQCHPTQSPWNIDFSCSSLKFAAVIEGEPRKVGVAGLVQGKLFVMLTRFHEQMIRHDAHGTSKYALWLLFCNELGLDLGWEIDSILVVVGCGWTVSHSCPMFPIVSLYRPRTSMNHWEKHPQVFSRGCYSVIICNGWWIGLGLRYWFCTHDGWMWLAIFPMFPLYLPWNIGKRW